MPSVNSQVGLSDFTTFVTATFCTLVGWLGN